MLSLPSATLQDIDRLLEEEKKKKDRENKIYIKNFILHHVDFRC